MDIKVERANRGQNRMYYFLILLTDRNQQHLMFGEVANFIQICNIHSEAIKLENPKWQHGKVVFQLLTLNWKVS